jgi:hypothetical protein
MIVYLRFSGAIALPKRKHPGPVSLGTREGRSASERSAYRGSLRGTSGHPGPREGSDVEGSRHTFTGLPHAGRGLGLVETAGLREGVRQAPTLHDWYQRDMVSRIILTYGWQG